MAPLTPSSESRTLGYPRGGGKTNKKKKKKTLDLSRIVTKKPPVAVVSLCAHRKKPAKKGNIELCLAETPLFF